MRVNLQFAEKGSNMLRLCILGHASALASESPTARKRCIVMQNVAPI
jgi:hypothetical protein